MHHHVNSAFEKTDLRPVEKLVLIALANHADANDFCYPSHSRLARLSNVSIATIKRVLKVLEKQGLVKIEARSREFGGKSSNGYTLKITPKIEAEL